MLFDDLDTFINEVEAFMVQIARKRFDKTYLITPYRTTEKAYCPGCADARTMEITNFASVDSLIFTIITDDDPDAEDTQAKQSPSLLVARCMQCEMRFTLVVHHSPDGPALAVFPLKGSLTTPNTPPAVSYYLEQAYLSMTAGAFTAAAAMYRVALEQLLFDRGYTAGMLDTKIKALEADLSSKTAADWALDLDMTFLDVLKKIGNSATHPKDPKKLAILDQEALRGIEITFIHLLDVIYEEPSRRADLLDGLKEIKSRSASKCD